MSTHLIKLAVGIEDVDHLAQVQAMRIQDNVLAGLGPYPRHVTRQRPKREAELLDGGSIYWVIKGMVRARQRILELDSLVDGEGISRCAIVLDADLHPTRLKAHRAFQGWRYLDPAKAPPDSATDGGAGDSEELPDDLARALDDLGLL